MYHVGDKIIYESVSDPLDYSGTITHIDLNHTGKKTNKTTAADHDVYHVMGEDGKALLVWGKHVRLNLSGMERAIDHLGEM